MSVKKVLENDVEATEGCDTYFDQYSPIIMELLERVYALEVALNELKSKKE